MGATNTTESVQGTGGSAQVSQASQTSQGSGAVQQTAQQTAPASTAQPTSQPSSTSQSVAQQTAGSVAGSASQDSGYVSVRDALAGYGLDLRQQFQDDHQVLQHLAVLARQAKDQQQLVQYGQQYLQYAPQFRQWLSEQEQKQQQQQQQSWWKAPEYDPTWQRRLMRDPQTGEIKALPGEPPDLVQKYLNWVEHQRSFLDKFSQNPIEAIKPGVLELVQQVAGQIVQQHLGQYQEQITAQQILAQNAAWMFEKDQTGNPIYSQTGHPVLTPLGRQYAQYVQEAQQLGIHDSQSQAKYAMALLRGEVLMARMAQQQQATPGSVQQTQQPPVDPATAVKQQFVNQAAGHASNHVPPPPGNTQGSYQPPNGVSQRGLQELLLQEFAKAGIQPGQQLVG